jgi:protein O-GlcNAc transferase
MKTAIDYCITDADRDPCGVGDLVGSAPRTVPCDAGESVHSADPTGSVPGHQVPPGMTDKLYSEQLVRLPVTSQCYRPSADAPPVGPAPALMRGHATFCCFNKLVKVSPGMIQAWAAILAAVPRSRLMVLAAGAGREDDAVRAAFVRQGVPADRLDLVRPLKRVDYLWRYNQADIGLDTFPYNGHTTTLDGLWMGSRP